MGWFKRKSQGIFTDSKSKKDVPEGLWYKCPNCKQLVPKEEHEKNDSLYAPIVTTIQELTVYSIFLSFLTITNMLKLIKNYNH